MRVRHQQDVDDEELLGPDDVLDAQVRIEVTVGETLPAGTSYRAVIDVPSGVLEVGDGEHVDHVPIGSGMWIMGLAYSPNADPDDVREWLAPAETVGTAASIGDT